MSLNNLKKTIIFSSEKAKHIVESIVADQAEIEKRSASSVMENHLQAAILPANKDGRFFVENYLYNSENGIGDTLHAIFSCCSSGTNWNSSHDNLLAIVQFAKREESFCNTTPSGEEVELHHCVSQMKSVVERFDYLIKNSPQNQEYKKSKNWAQSLLDELQSDPKFSRYANFYQILLDNWDDFKGWSITYRLLDDLAQMEKGWRNYAETKIELLNIIKQVTDEWEDKK